MVGGKLVNGDGCAHSRVIELHRAGALSDEDALLVIDGDLHRIIEGGNDGADFKVVITGKFAAGGFILSPDHAGDAQKKSECENR